MVEALPIYKGKSVRARLNSLQQIMVDWDESESAVIIEKQNVIDWDRKVPPPPPPFYKLLVSGSMLIDNLLIKRRNIKQMCSCLKHRPAINHLGIEYPQSTIKRVQCHGSASNDFCCLFLFKC